MQTKDQLLVYLVNRATVGLGFLIHTVISLKISWPAVFTAVDRPLPKDHG